MHQVSVVSILFIDNPVGTGYSYVTHDSAYTKDVYQIAQDLLTTVTAFLTQLPGFQVESFVLIRRSSIMLVSTEHSEQIIIYGLLDKSIQSKDASYCPEAKTK